MTVPDVLDAFAFKFSLLLRLGSPSPNDFHLADSPLTPQSPVETVSGPSKAHLNEFLLSPYYSTTDTFSAFAYLKE